MTACQVGAGGGSLPVGEGTVLRRQLTFSGTYSGMRFGPINHAPLLSLEAALGTRTSGRGGILSGAIAASVSRITAGRGASTSSPPLSH